MTNFERDLILGKSAEREAFLFLLNQRNTAGIIDSSNDEYYQKLDVDLLVLTNTGKIVKYEVKYDRMCDETGNIVFETKSNGNIGCLERSHADWLYYRTKSTTYLIDMASLRKYIQYELPTEIDMGDGAKGFLLKVDRLIERRIAYEIDSKPKSSWKLGLATDQAPYRYRRRRVRSRDKGVWNKEDEPAVEAHVEVHMRNSIQD